MVTAFAGPTSGHVFSDGSADYECYTAPPSYCAPGYDTQFADCSPRVLDLSQVPWLLADQLDDERLVAGAGPGGCCGGYGSYTAWWGAVSPQVARLSVTIGNGEENDPHGESVGDALLQSGYFMAIFNEPWCCLVEYVAYDAAGNVIDERQRPSDSRQGRRAAPPVGASEATPAE